MQGDDSSGEDPDGLTERERRVLQAIYDLLRERDAWPTFRTVDLHFDRRLGISDAQAALASVPLGYLQRSWHSFGFYDNDEVRLTSQGILECDGGLEDLQLLTRLIQWLCEVEQSQDDGDESDPVVEITDFAEAIGLNVESDRSENAPCDWPEESDTAIGETDVGPEEQTRDDEVAEIPPVSKEAQLNRATLVRLRLLADLLPRFWSGTGWNEPWRWRCTIDRRGLRPYRSIQTVSQLLGYANHAREQAARVEASARISSDAESPDTDPLSEPESTDQPEHGDEISVLLTILRPEIADSAGAQLRSGLYEDAIFAAYRRVEAAVQERSGLPRTIGDPLVKQAFKELSSPIKVSERDQDADRLIQLFGGAIGLYKGDRSHKDKPALPCRSLRECLRQLANASALLDLLDRDIAVAPAVRGYDHRGDTLELRVDHASAQSQVWLDDRLCDIVRHGPGSLIIDVAGVPIGEHELFVTDGTRTGPLTFVWLTSGSNETGWQRVTEVHIPLFTGVTGLDRLEASGLRLTVRENGVISERVVPTTGTYRVGDYVHQHFNFGISTGDPSAVTAVGPAWVNDVPGVGRRQLWDSSALFDGQPYGPDHEPRLMKITLEPRTLLLRKGTKAPIRALGHYTDGVVTWAEPLKDTCITPDDSEIIHAESGTVFAKWYGKTTLRLLADGLYAASTVHVAAHPKGTLTDVLTALPPVAGLAWAKDSLLISTRTDGVWHVDAKGRYTLAVTVPLQPPGFGGTDAIAASENGDLAVRLYGHWDVLVLDGASDYSKSRRVSLPENSIVTAMTWDGDDLILGLHTGSILRVRADNRSEQIIELPGKTIVSLTHSDDTLLVLTRGKAVELWRVNIEQGSGVADAVLDREGITANVVAWLNGSLYFTDFNGGRVLRLDDKNIVEVAVGLRNPGELAAGPDGSVYVAEFSRGAVRRLFS